MKYIEKAANCLNACDTYIYPGIGSLPIGTIYAGNLPYTGTTGVAYPLFIILP